MKLCPNYIHVWPVEYIRDDEEKPFYNDIFQLIDDPKIFNLKAIRARTPYKVSIRILACQNVKKDEEDNYCKELHDCESEKKICELGTKYVFFYIDKSKKENAHPKPTVYLLVFTKSTRDIEMQSIVDEVKKIKTKYLEVTNCFVDCHIFEYSKYPNPGITIAGTIKERFKEHCKDESYRCQASSIQQGQWLYINAGESIFNFTTRDNK